MLIIVLLTILKFPKITPPVPLPETVISFPGEEVIVLFVKLKFPIFNSGTFKVVVYKLLT